MDLGLRSPDPHGKKVEEARELIAEVDAWLEDDDAINADIIIALADALEGLLPDD